MTWATSRETLSCAVRGSCKPNTVQWRSTATEVSRRKTLDQLVRSAAAGVGGGVCRRDLPAPIGRPDRGVDDGTRLHPADDGNRAGEPSPARQNPGYPPDQSGPMMASR